MCFWVFLCTCTETENAIICFQSAKYYIILELIRIGCHNITTAILVIRVSLQRYLWFFNEMMNLQTKKKNVAT